MRILATSVFERIVYHCFLVEARDPDHLVLEVDAIVREGDADGPLLVAVADLKRMAGVEVAVRIADGLRARGRTETRDGVEYLAFPMWRPVTD